MPTITKKEFEEYRMMCYDRDNGRLLTSEGLRFICEANNYDPEKIGRHFLEILSTVYPRKEFGNE